jgi:hypothetical protein
MTAVEWRIAALCEQLADEELSRLLADADAETVLRRVLDAIRAGEPAKVSAADLDALEDAAASAGIDGLTTGVRAFDRGHLDTSARHPPRRPLLRMGMPAARVHPRGTRHPGHRAGMRCQWSAA